MKYLNYLLNLVIFLCILGALWVLVSVATGCASTDLAGMLTDAPIRRTGAAYLRSCIYEDGQACCIYSNSVSMHEEVWCKPATFGAWTKVGENDWSEAR